MGFVNRYVFTLNKLQDCLEIMIVPGFWFPKQQCCQGDVCSCRMLIVGAEICFICLIFLPWNGDSYKDAGAGSSDDNICCHRICSHTSSKSQTMYLKTLFCKIEFLQTGATLLICLLYLFQAHSQPYKLSCFIFLSLQELYVNSTIRICSVSPILFPSINSLKRK